MATGLLQLSDECILLILENLYPRQIRRLAQTCNRRLYSITYPLLESLRKRQKTLVHFQSLFESEPLDDSDTFSEEVLKKHELLPLDGTSFSPPKRPTDHLEYLNLDGNLNWYRSAVKFNGMNEGAFEGTEVAYLPRELNELIEQASELGLTLPQPFIQFLTDERLVEHLPTKQAWRVQLSRLHKIRIPPAVSKLAADSDAVRPTQDREQEGYIFTWYVDQQCCYFTNMYLDTSGRHAMLGSFSGAYFDEEGELDLNDPNLVTLTEKDKEQGVVQTPSDFASVQRLEEIDFEHWLVNRYYEERIWFLTTFPEDDPPPEHIKRYLRNVFTEEGRCGQ